MWRSLIYGLAITFALIAASYAGFIWYVGTHVFTTARFETGPQLLALEARLYRGEPRKLLEAFFGFGIPKPEEIHLYGPQTFAGRQHPFVAYYYLSTTQFCVETFKGDEIQLDRDDRIVSWKRVGFTLGC